MASEEEYAQLVALGLLRPAKTAAVDARDLLYSIESPWADRLAEAVRAIAEVEQELGQLAVDESERNDRREL
jgi:hypothetical protein